jgi:pyruvate/2-oxoglutarate dehydrogenase complex dihydrolipoamide dehydrogenase (E3) component
MVEVGGKTLRFKKAVIATGTRPTEPLIPGLAEAGFLTNETVFSLTERPRRLAVIGGGPIGCELAQAFRRLGCEVTLHHRAAHVLNREDVDAAEIIQQSFIREGIRLILNCQTKRVEKQNGEKVLFFECQGKEEKAAVDEILVGIGRTPNVEGLNLESVGVKYDRKEGLEVNEQLQTTNPRIFAAGDICLKYKFTHTADATARMVIQNALFRGSKKVSSLTIPWCTYTDPEIAHVGMYEKDVRERGIEVETFARPLRDVDRAIADGEEEGFVKIHVRKGTDKILGATIVACHAGEMISEITLAMAGNLGLKTLSTVIHCYPTQAEAIKQAADAYSRTRLTPFIRRLIHRWLAWTR